LSIESISNDKRQTTTREKLTVSQNLHFFNGAFTKVFSAFPSAIFVDGLVSLQGIKRNTSLKNESAAAAGLGHWSESHCRRKDDQHGRKEAGHHGSQQIWIRLVSL
jgi:hypothetical protein